MFYSIDDNIKEIDSRLYPDESFDIIKRDLIIGGRKAVLYFIDGFIKDAVFEKLLEFLYKIQPEELSDVITMDEFMMSHMPYTEAISNGDFDSCVTAVLSGPALIIIDGIKDGMIIDTRAYPVRSIEEPQKDRSVRGSKDGFIESLIFNTALLRRRIRDPKFRLEYHKLGKRSKVDVAIGYIDGLADDKVVEKLRKRLGEIDINGISMTGQAISELLVPTAFFNPLPKIKVTERPDFASACVLEGKVVLLMDNSPGVMILPVSFADFYKEVDDFYFPTVTGSYIRTVRLISSLLTVYLVPLVIYFYYNHSICPNWLINIIGQGKSAIPLWIQFLILEFVVDSLRLASVNTPDNLSNSIGIIGALLLSEFAISSGWFLPQAILYSSFVAISSFSQPSFEMGYSAKFFRIFAIIAVRFFGLYGLLGVTFLAVLLMIFSKTLSGRKYFYPIIPFNFKEFCKLFVRTGINSENH